MTDKNYADRDHMALGDYYTRHVSAMTGEGLHSKSAIAAELAHRDAEIDRLRAALAAAQAPQPARVALTGGQITAGVNALRPSAAGRAAAHFWFTNGVHFAERSHGIPGTDGAA